MHRIGLDVGSVAVKAVVFDGDTKNILKRVYQRHLGHPIEVCSAVLRDLLGTYPSAALSVTGSAGKFIAGALNIKHVNEVAAQAYAVRKLYPQIQTIIELGGEDAKLIILEDGKIRDFSLNSVCAAGTGSFLEQQAERLKLGIEEFSAIAERSERPSKIAGRCSVFAKSDMIHLQQIATPMEDIVAGLCFAVARNFKGSIAKGIELRPPVAFQGGVAANAGMRRAFQEIFHLEKLIVPPDYALMGAIGAALRDADAGRAGCVDISMLDALMSGRRVEEGQSRLLIDGDGFSERHMKQQASDSRLQGAVEEQTIPAGHGVSAAAGQSSRITAYLGIDIGSISTNVAVIDEHGNLLAKQYLMTAGRPLEAVKKGLADAAAEVAGLVEIAGVGTTGSGRYMIADFVGADVVKNEITAQATAAISIDSAVDTIFEIGGQDSKYISLRDGIIVDFEMNKACAAGTGSFIEEQADKLGISVKEEFAGQALHACSPCHLGERCTVFMENSLMANLQRGAQKDNLLAGLAYSIVQNYINRVVAGRTVGSHVFFQGGVAFNKAVVAAFEKYLGTPVTVPPNHDVTGAIGMALIARQTMRERPGAKTQFKGFTASQRPYDIKSFECRSCENVCEINRVRIEGDEGFLFYGGRCEKFDVRRSQKATLPDNFLFREQALWKAHDDCLDAEAEKEKPGNRPKIGIPYIFTFHDFLPYWSTFLREIGFEVVVSPKTNRQIVNAGVENVLSEACFPVKVAHGHKTWLKKAGVDALFSPSFINLNTKKDEYPSGLVCPYVQTIPYVTTLAVGGIINIAPSINLSLGLRTLAKEIQKSFADYGISRSRIEKALIRAQEAQDSYRETVKHRGAAFLKELALVRSGNRSAISDEHLRALPADQPVVVIVGRGYNSFDMGMNLEIPKKLAQIGVLSLPMDMLPLQDIAIREAWPQMYWRSGQRILKAARFIRQTPGLYAIYIGNFSCGPDSFILKYFKEEMGDKPFLHLEIDEHSADAGAITRCEAFVDSIQQQLRAAAGRDDHAAVLSQKPAEAKAHSIRQRTFFIPQMSDHAFSIAAALESCGVPAAMLPPSDRASVDLGRKYVSGKECYPYLVTTGDMLKMALATDFVPERSAFFMPSGSGPCRFGQYSISHRLILDKLGFEDVPIFAPNQDVAFYEHLGSIGKDFALKAWKGVVAYELLTKCLHETRPYEIHEGDSDELYQRYHEKIYGRVAAKNGGVEHVLEQMQRDFGAIPRTGEERPLIGLVGEIFVRSHRFSNEELIRKIEGLGGEVWLAPMGEWISYINAMAYRKALIKKDFSAIIQLFTQRFFQRRIEHRYMRHFGKLLKTVHEPETEELFTKAAPYIHHSFEGETILSVGKAVDLIEKGAAGIINAMPFGCMPGTIVTAIMKGIVRDYGIPSISIPYDGTESPTTDLQIEAFMEAVQSRKYDVRSGK
ncbi:MAG TPA: acyl-CoA dehydratase activase [Dissulfurispiraceae bacterium]|nr:acyl-CoA dehydratase activase [Dissulfurispiraceae bacterium]